MAGPITWQNIAAPSYTEASRGLALAQQGINSGFDSFNNVIKQQTEAENANWEQVKKNNTEAFMTKLYQAQGAEGFKALQDSGELQRMLAANGAQIDAAAARSAMDGRLATLQQRDVAGMQYQKAVEENAQDPVVRQIQMLSLKNPAAAQALLDQNPNLRRGFEVAQGIDTRGQVLKDRVWNEQKQQWETAAEEQKVKLRPLEVQKFEAEIRKAKDDLLTAGSHRALYGAQTELAKAQAAATAIKAEDAALDGTGGSGAAGSGGKGANAAFDRIVANSPYDKGSIDTLAGKEALYKALKEIGLSDNAKADILYNLDKYYKNGAVVGHDTKGNPIRVPLPVSAVIDAVQGSSDNPLAIGFSRRGDDVVNLLDKRFGVKSDGSTNNDTKLTRDEELIKRMLLVQDLRTQREAPTLAPGAPTTAEVARQALREAARRNTEAQLGKK
jgi:hypothetical protein